MRLTIKLILGSVLALLLGVAVASPILVQNLELGAKVQIQVDVVYAYFGVQEFNRSITGLWRNFSDPWEWDLHIVSYLIVLNVTNRSDRLATIEEFQVSAAQEILVTNGTNKIGSEELARSFRTNQTSSDGSNPTDRDFGVAQANTIVMDARDLKGAYFWSQYWSPDESRLIGLRGTTEVANVAAYKALTTGTIYLFGKAEGRPLDGGSQSRGFSLKHVQLQMFEREFLYNVVVSENQILRFDSNGIDVYIEARR